MTHPPTSPGYSLALKSLHDFWSDIGGLDVDDAEVSPVAAGASAPALKRPAEGRPESGANIRPESAPERPSAGSPANPSGRPEPRRLQANPIAEARKLALGAATLQELKSAIERFDGCPLKQAAKSTVVCDGAWDAPVMIIGEGPGGEEDATGLPFVGRSGKLLDRMLAAIGLSRARNVYITNLVFWRPPGNRDPSAAELQVCAPFLTRQIELKQPKLILTAGKFATQAMLGTDEGIMRLRGRRTPLKCEGLNQQVPLPPIPCIPFLHPAYLLRRPGDKAKAWEDLLTIAATCDELGITRGESL